MHSVENKHINASRPSDHVSLHIDLTKGNGFFASWQHQGITWTNVHLSSKVFWDIHFGVIFTRYAN